MQSSEQNKVVVLIIIYQAALTSLEMISLRQCLKVLEKHTIRVVKPRSVDLSSWTREFGTLEMESFPDRHFSDVGTYSRLLVSPGFYKRFEAYEYMLIYQLDAFVFTDELNAWCDAGYDYIGAPWFEGFSHNNENAGLIGVGNGGFSLRNVQAHLKVLRSFSYLSAPATNWRTRMATKPTGASLLRHATGFFIDLLFRNNTFWLLNSFYGFEDQFWGLIAARNYKWFKMPDEKTAMKFSYEMQPRRLFEWNQHRLPFGCHGWWKYDFDFWKPLIRASGYTV